MSAREGPYQTFPHGQYEGVPVIAVMKSDMQYFLQAVKDWLNVTPAQAGYFKQITKGGEIPPHFIGETHKEISNEEWKPPKEYTREDIRVVEKGYLAEIPNYDFDPKLAPGWWKTYKEKSKGLRPAQKWNLYNDLLNKELNDFDRRT